MGDKKQFLASTFQRTRVPAHDRSVHHASLKGQREELLMRNEVLHPEVSFRFSQLNTLNAREACSSCSNHCSIRRASFVPPNHLRCTHARCIAIRHSFGAVANISIHLPANFGAVFFNTVAFRSLSIGSLSVFDSLELSRLITPLLSFLVKMCIVLLGFI